MAGLQMERLTTTTPMVARILVARLGAEGIVWQVRGSIDGPLAVGPVEILVDAEALPAAQELLLADEVEDALSGEIVDDRPATGRDRLLVAAAILFVILFALARMHFRV